MTQRIEILVRTFTATPGSTVDHVVYEGPRNELAESILKLWQDNPRSGSVILRSI